MNTHGCLAIAAGLTLLLSMAATEAVAQAPLADPPYRPADQEPELVQLLDASLGSLAEQTRQGRMIGGYVLIGLGAAAVVGGVATLAAWDDEDADVVGYSLIGGGVLLGTLSLLPFKLRDEVERIYDEFSEMPSGSAAEVRTKFAYGDRRFEELAGNRRTGRYISGAVLLGIGITELFVDDEPSQWIGFGTPIVAGVTTLLIKTEVERSYEAYRRAKDDLVAEATDAPTVGVGLGVLPRRGLAWTVQLRF